MVHRLGLHMGPHAYARRAAARGGPLSARRGRRRQPLTDHRRAGRAGDPAVRFGGESVWRAAAEGPDLHRPDRGDHRVGGNRPHPPDISPGQPVLGDLHTGGTEHGAGWLLLPVAYIAYTFIGFEAS